MKKTHQTLLSFYRSLEIRLLTVSSPWPMSVRRYGDKEEQERGGGGAMRRHFEMRQRRDGGDEFPEMG